MCEKISNNIKNNRCMRSNSNIFNNYSKNAILDEFNKIIITQEETKLNLKHANKNLILDEDEEKNFCFSRQIIARENLLIFFSDGLYNNKRGINYLIDLASILKMDIITYSFSYKDEKPLIKKRILALKVFYRYLIKNVYNINDHFKKHLFVYTKHSTCLEGLLISNKLANKNFNFNDKIHIKLNFKGLIIENAVEFKKFFQFIFSDYSEKFYIPTFFINGKKSFNINEFFSDYKFIKKLFINITEWFPEDGDFNNINSKLRNIYLEKLKFFINNYNFLSMKKNVIYQNKEIIKNLRKISYEEDYNKIDSSRTFTLKFEDHHFQKNQIYNNKYPFNNESSLKMYRDTNASNVDFLTEKNFQEKEYDLENFCNISFDKKLN